MFEKNINLLEKVNKSLANKIRRVNLSEASQRVKAIKNEKGEYILTCDNKYVDDTPSPTEAAQKIYEESVKSAVSRHDFIVIFGLGLGNLLDYTHDKSVCSLIVYEPDLDILRFTFEYVDLTKYFYDGRLYISNNLAECTNYIEKKYLLDDKIEFVYLKNYVLQHPGEFKVLTERIFEVCQSKIIDMNTTKRLSKDWINNIFSNISGVDIHYPINILENRFKDKTALVLGAGPSLKDNIEKIKEHRENFVIFAVHRTLETLRINGITPDFCVVIDSKYVKNSITPNLKYLSEINLISDIKADTYLKKLNFKNVFTYYSKNNLFSNRLEEKLPTKIKALETGGTATICAYRCAKYLGFKNIIFAGIDLAFKNDTVYCDGQIAVANNENSVKIQNIIRNITTVKSVTGEYVSTRTDYANFVKQFEMLFVHDKTSNLYNVTTFGAFINGMKYLQMEEIIKTVSSDSTDSENIIKTAINENLDLPDIVAEASRKIVNEEYEKIKNIVELTNEWFEMYAEHPNFFDYAAKILVLITSSMILQEYLQIELIKFSKLMFTNDDTKKKEFLIDIFKLILSYNKNLHNLI